MYKDVLVVPNSLRKIAEVCVLYVLTTNLNRTSPRIVHMQTALCVFAISFTIMRSYKRLMHQRPF